MARFFSSNVSSPLCLSVNVTPHASLASQIFEYRVSFLVRPHCAHVLYWFVIFFGNTLYIRIEVAPLHVSLYIFSFSFSLVPFTFLPFDQPTSAIANPLSFLSDSQRTRERDSSWKALLHRLLIRLSRVCQITDRSRTHPRARLIRNPRRISFFLCLYTTPYSGRSYNVSVFGIFEIHK